ncbi:hypothetical protein BH23BAC1_BH23BAC1_48600 [soil metagenome]
MVNEKYKELKKYALYLLENHLDFFTKENIQLAMEFSLPGNKIIFDWKEEEYFKFIKWRTEIFLGFFKQNDPLIPALEELEKWKNDTMPQVTGRLLKIEDLSGSFIIRKIVLTKLLSLYTFDFVLMQEIIVDVDKFYYGWEKEAFRILSELQNNHLLNEIDQRTKELSRKNEELTKINTDLDNFIYTASHDLKAPVSNIEGLINHLKVELEENKPLNDNLEQIFNMITKSVNRFRITLRDLTEIGKIQKNLQEDEEEINIEELIEEAKLVLANLITISLAEVHFTTQIMPVIKFSSQNLRSIVYNLISNAIKYRSYDRDPIIKISCDKQENMFILKVEDNGLGIKQENISKMFEMFKRLHSHVEGTGIGLYLVKRIMENSGGKIQVESEEGKGTIFTLFFKIK